MKVGTTSKLVAGIATSLVMAVGVGASVFADSPGGGVVGNWAVHDHGQGCWAGGNLRADGTGDGGGNCSFSTPLGQEVASLKPVSWSFTDSTDTAVTLNATITGKKGPAFPIGVPVPTSITVPVNTDTPINLGSDTYGKVTIH